MCVCVCVYVCVRITRTCRVKPGRNDKHFADNIGQMYVLERKLLYRGSHLTFVPYGCDKSA